MWSCGYAGNRRCGARCSEHLAGHGGYTLCRPCQTQTAPHLHIWTSRLQPAAVAQALERGVRPQNDVLDSFSKEQVREFGDVELDPHM